MPAATDVVFSVSTCLRNGKCCRIEEEIEKVFFVLGELFMLSVLTIWGINSDYYVSEG